MANYFQDNAFFSSTFFQGDYFKTNTFFQGGFFGTAFPKPATGGTAPATTAPADAPNANPSATDHGAPPPPKARRGKGSK